MEHTYDIITVGDAKLDIFLVMPEAKDICQIDHEHSWLCVSFGNKIDVSHSEFLMGGNAANVAVGLSRLGIRAALCAEIGDDEFSLKILNSLAKEQIDRGLVTYTQSSQSSFSIILEVGGDRTIFSEHIHRPHAFKLDNFTAKYVYLTSLGEEWQEPYAKVLSWAKQHQVKIIFNPGSLQLASGGQIIQDILKSTDILFVNKEEAQRLTGAKLKIKNEEVKMDSNGSSFWGAQATPESRFLDKSQDWLWSSPDVIGIPTSRGQDNQESDQIKELLISLKRLGPKVVVITDGAKGAYAIDEKGQIYSQPIFPAKIVGRTGAGDAFASGFLGAVCLRKEVQTALQWGSVNSAAVIEHIGAETGLLKRDALESRLKGMNNKIGWMSPLYILAFDHRNTFAEHMFGGKKLEDLTPQERAEVVGYKELIYQGFQMAISNGLPKEDAAILVDEEFGDTVLKQAASDGVKTILTIEKSGQKSFDFQYGEQFGDHIEKYHPTFTKVLIHYNPADPADLKQAQQKNLKTISDYSHEHGYKFLLEVLIAGTVEQLSSVNNDKEQYDAQIRPDLTVQVIKELQEAGVEPDIWKMEGLDSKESYEHVITQARSGDRSEVSLVILGRGAGEEKVEEWLRIGASVSGVVGFAVGRTIFWQPLMDVHNKAIARDDAVRKISEEFQKLYKVFVENTSKLM